MDSSYSAANIIAIVNSYIDKGNYDSAYRVYLKSQDKLSPEDKKNLQYSFPPKYFKKIEKLKIPYEERIKYELEKGSPIEAYEFFLENEDKSQKAKLLFLNQCLETSKKCINIERKDQFNTILNKILPKHQEYINKVKPSFSIEYKDFCKELEKLYNDYYINDYDKKELVVRKSAYDLGTVTELIHEGQYQKARQLYYNIENRKKDILTNLNQKELILLYTKENNVLNAIIQKATESTDIFDAIELYKTNIIPNKEYFVKTRVAGLIKQKINDYCLDLFNQKNYDEINLFYKKLSDSGFYDEKDATTEKEKAMFVLIDEIFLPLPEDRIVNQKEALDSVLSTMLAHTMIDNNIISKESLQNHLSSVISEHNRKIETIIQMEEEEKRERLAIEERKDKILRRTCDYRTRDIINHGVKYLYHFTKLTNIKSILENGILPVETLDELNIEYDSNDDGRYDEQLDATSISLSFPNWKTFYSFREKDKTCKWAVIEIAVNMLYDNIFECYSTNASTGHGRYKVYKGYELFGNSQDENPEDPQAELLVKGRIDPKYITRIYVNDFESKQLLTGISKPVEINNYYFSKRRKDL